MAEQRHRFPPVTTRNGDKPSNTTLKRLRAVTVTSRKQWRPKHRSGQRVSASNKKGLYTVQPTVNPGASWVPSLFVLSFFLGPLFRPMLVSSAHTLEAARGCFLRFTEGEEHGRWSHSRQYRLWTTLCMPFFAEGI